PHQESEPEDSAALYYHLTHDELIRKILDQDSELRSRREQLRDLENYIDHLLVQIMETSPAILQVPAGKSKTAKR
uniref:FIP-RBD domain-containing protein n=1 Tax=Callorhinchus milii TaxID=7868 RepID=A0A4W3IM61_CALMI